MQTWWKRWAERLSGSAVPIDGDPGKWRKPSDPASRGGRKVRSGRLEASAAAHRRLAGGAIERSWRWDLQLPPPAA
jgi:hypothetical protein